NCDAAKHTGLLRGLLERMWPCRVHRDGSRSRSVHSLADPARRQRLLRRRRPIAATCAIPHGRTKRRQSRMEGRTATARPSLVGGPEPQCAEFTRRSIWPFGVDVTWQIDRDPWVAREATIDDHFADDALIRDTALCQSRRGDHGREHCAGDERAVMMLVTMIIPPDPGYRAHKPCDLVCRTDSSSDRWL